MGPRAGAESPVPKFAPMARGAWLSLFGFLFIGGFPAPAAAGGLAFSGNLGTQSRPDFSGTGFGYGFSAYYKFDDQVLLGVQSGQGVAGKASAVPLLGVLYARLPIGRVVMPVATAGIGSVLRDSSGLLWRAGGLFDIRNGRKSSLLLGSEYEGRGEGRGGLVFRAGLLVEF